MNDSTKSEKIQPLLQAVIRLLQAHRVAFVQERP